MSLFGWGRVFSVNTEHKERPSREEWTPEHRHEVTSFSKVGPIVGAVFISLSVLIAVGRVVRGEPFNTYDVILMIFFGMVGGVCVLPKVFVPLASKLLDRLPWMANRLPAHSHNDEKDER